MADVFRRIFGLGPGRASVRPDNVIFDNGSGTRIMQVDDPSANAIAARQSFSQLYGADNVPDSMFRRSIIQVQGKDGNWQNVTGGYIPAGGMSPQVAALDSYRATGQIGIAPTVTPNVSSGALGASAPNMMDPLNLPAAASQLTPEAVGFLNATALGESNGRYDIRYDGSATGASFDTSTNQHPRISVPGPAGPSTAAGRYMFTGSTWDNVAGAGTPFTKENQDLMAWKLATQDYRKRTGRDLQTDLSKNGLTPEIMNSMKGTWTAYGNTGAYVNYQKAYEAGLTGAQQLPRNGATGPMIGTTALGQEQAAFGTLFDAPQSNRSQQTASDIFSQPTLADALPEAPGVVSRVQTPATPQLIAPSRSF